MAGCGGGSCGIQNVREAERQRVLELLREAYPDGTCQGASLSDLVAGGLDLDACHSLGPRIEDVLPVRALPCRAGTGELGDSLYLLCGIHAPCLFELREGLCPKDAAMLRSRETYLRVGLSPLGRFATLQETVLEVESLPDTGRLVVERPCVGVENRELRLLVTGLQGLLRREKIVLLDFAFLMQPFGDAPDPAFASLWQSTPTLWSVLFDPAPPSTTRETIV